MINCIFFEERGIVIKSEWNGDRRISVIFFFLVHRICKTLFMINELPGIKIVKFQHRYKMLIEFMIRLMLFNADSKLKQMASHM